MRKLFGIFCAMLLSVAFVSNKAVAQPTPKNAATVEARKRMSEAQLALNELKAEEKRIKDKRRNEFQTEKEEWKTTLETHKKRTKEYDEAKAKALAAAKAKPQYKAALKNKAELQKKLDELSAKKDADPAQITKTANRLTQEGFAIKKIETDATKHDAKVIEAKEMFEESEKEVKLLDEEVDSSLAADPDYMALKTQIEQAEQQFTQAKEAYVQAQKADRPVKAAPTPKRPSKSSEEGI